MDELTSTQGIVALAAAGVAVLTLLLVIVLFVKLRAVRSAQTAVLGDHGSRDLVGHAQRLETGFVDLRDWVEETFGRLDERVGAAEERIDGCVTHRGLVRYDAYGEMSGHQSVSLALLDARQSGVVVSSISHRDQARIYFKQIREGESEIELSPEEREAVHAALGTRAESAAASA